MSAAERNLILGTGAEPVLHSPALRAVGRTRDDGTIAFAARGAS